jgi:hypothetical protein
MSFEDLLNSRDLSVEDGGETLRRVRAGANQAIYDERVSKIINEWIAHLKSEWNVQLTHEEWVNLIRRVERMFTDLRLPFTGESFNYARRTLLGLRTAEENLCDLIEDTSDLGSHAVRKDFTQRQKQILGC